jgi:hypothetical protein
MSVTAIIEAAEREGRYDGPELVIFSQEKEGGVILTVGLAGDGFRARCADAIRGIVAFGPSRVAAVEAALDGYLDLLNGERPAGRVVPFA